MNIYKVSCFSKCGTYFAAYLQSVTVTANDSDEALQTVRRHFEVAGDSFIYPENEWRTELLVANVVTGEVVDTQYDSDY